MTDIKKVYMVHIGKCIAKELRKQRRSVQWFAEKLYCDRSNVYRLFQKESADANLILRVSRILDRDFFELYSSEFKEQACGSGNPADCPAQAGCE